MNEDTPIENEVETEVESQVNDSEVESSESTEAVEKEQKFKPWTIKKEKETEDHIPYSRFREVNEERKAYASRLEKLEADLAKYTEREKVLEKIKGPEDIDIANYTDPNEYLKDLTKATKEQAIREVEERFLAREQEKIREQRQKEIVSQYESNMAKAIEHNPEVKEAAAFLDQYAKNIHPDIAYELLMDENVGELIYNITTDQDLLRELFKGNPTDFIRKLHKMSAKIDRGSSTPAQVKNKEVEVPAALKKDIAKGIPAQVKGSNRATKDPSKMTMAEYRAWRSGK